MNYTTKTLGELLSSPDETIKRNAVSILKRLQHKCETLDEQRECAYGSIDAAYCTFHNKTH